MNNLWFLCLKVEDLCQIVMWFCENVFVEKFHIFRKIN